MCTVMYGTVKNLYPVEVSLSGLTNIIQLGDPLLLCHRLHIPYVFDGPITYQVDIRGVRMHLSKDFIYKSTKKAYTLPTHFIFGDKLRGQH
jgi:hypothetical protein